MLTIKVESELLSLMLAMLKHDVSVTITARILIDACSTNSTSAVILANRKQLLCKLHNVSNRFSKGHAYKGSKQFVRDVTRKVALSAYCS